MIRETPKLWKSALFRSALVLGLLLSASACDDDDPLTPPGQGLTASFTGSGAAAAPNLVRLVGGAVDDDLLTINVAIGGPTTSTDIYSFSFDLVLGNATDVEYVANSVTAGPMLSPTGCASILRLASQTDERVTVGVSKAGACAGNGSAAAEATVVSLQFRVLDPTSTTITIEGPPSDPDSPVAQDSNLAVIGSISFDDGNATIIGTD